MPVNKTVLITGANSGMGKALSILMASQNYEVFMLCRDKNRGQQAVEEVKSKTGNNHVRLELCDLSCLNEIRKFSRDFLGRTGKLDVLVCNAGVVLPGRRETRDGYELQFGVNHLGHFLLTKQLMPILSKATGARIVIVSSGAHKMGKIHFDDINLTKKFTFWKAYAQSKLANMLFCYELSRRLHATDITVNCLHPGAVATNMGINRETGFGTLITKILKPVFKTPEQGAETAFYLAQAPEANGISGKYFINKKIAKPSGSATDPEMAAKLWKLSEDMIRETFDI